MDQNHEIFFAPFFRNNDRDASTMRAIAQDPAADEEERYYSLDFLAKRCDLEALATLSQTPYEPWAACQQRALTLGLFGRCNYRPAAPLLVQAIDDSCLDAVAAAEKSLRVFFPGAPKSFDSFEALKVFFQNAAGLPREARLAYQFYPEVFQPSSSATDFLQRLGGSATWLLDGRPAMLMQLDERGDIRRRPLSPLQQIPVNQPADDGCLYRSVVSELLVVGDATNRVRAVAVACSSADETTSAAGKCSDEVVQRAVRGGAAGS